MTDHPPYHNHDKYTSFYNRYGLVTGLFVLLIAFSLSVSSCFEETFTSDFNVEFTTSVDTLRFDTVFTSVGSATRQILVYNPSDENINISSIGLAKGNESMFRLNVDGVPGNQSTEIPVFAKDSVYLFLEVTVDPDQPISVSPFIISEELIIRSGDKSKIVTLEAWGQNANYFPSRDAQGQIVGLSCNNNNITWDDPKPYVVYGLLFIDSCTLDIAPGTQVFVHGGIAKQEDIIFNDGGLFFLGGGRMNSQGTIDRPVVFQGDRLESSFDDVKGQWSGIRFLSESKENMLTHTEIRNSSVGIRLDSAASLELQSVTIANTSNIGLIAIHAEVKADNTLIHSNGPQSIAMVDGGDYEFRYCTIANFQNQSSGVYMDNFTCLNEECSAVAINPLRVNFVNSIIMGSNDDELDINDATQGEDESVFQLTFDHTIIKVEDSKMNYAESACQNCLEHMDEPVFLDEILGDFSLDTMSLARDQGVPIMDISSDILGNQRDATTPDLGCFEFID